jgi:predicted metal-binding protein
MKEDVQYYPLALLSTIRWILHAQFRARKVRELSCMKRCQHAYVLVACMMRIEKYIFVVVNLDDEMELKKTIEWSCSLSWSG